MDCAITAVNTNNGFFMCSTTGSITPKKGHVSHDAHVIAKSWCAPTCFFSVWCVQTQAYLPSSVNTTIPRASRCEYVPAGWHIRPSLYTAPAVLNRGTAFALNCNRFHVYPRHSHAQRPSFGPCIRGVVRIVLDTSNDRSYTVMRKRQKKKKQEHTRFLTPNNRNAPLLGNPAPH